ncbi:hypothetical protein R3P38DRAFT_1187942 [Favolaschia claudopus]|uniref:Uncharacterized protein n=1 Tax=Favolaschia claudopus TaxID=2862362 RepID=A0AAW0E2Q9_9AGAR
MSFEDPEFPILDEDEDGLTGFVSPDRTRTSSFFTDSHNFTIKGGHFAVHNHISTEQGAPRGRPKAFREIDWCDIFLEDNLDVARVRAAAPGRCSVRRNIYSAKIEGQQNPDKTVVIYEGDGAKQVCTPSQHKHKQGFRIVSLIRRGTKTSRSIFECDTPVFYNCLGYHILLACTPQFSIVRVDLVPIERVIEVYSHEPITKIYFHNFLVHGFLHHAAELTRMLQVETLTTSDDCSLWLNTAGQLCIELGRRRQFLQLTGPYDFQEPRLLAATTDLIPAHQLLDIVENLTLDGFYSYLVDGRAFQLSLEKGTSVKVRPGSVIGVRLPRHERLTADEIHLSLLNEYTSRDVKEVAFLNETNFTLSIQGQGRMMESGWIRAKIPRYTGTGKVKSIQTHLRVDIFCASKLFASQAVYIFNHTKDYSPSNFYFMVNFISIEYALMPTRKRTRLRGRVSLFLPPAKYFLSPDGTQLQFSNQPPYWSFQHSGNSPLSPEEAAIFGLPSVETKIRMAGIYYSPQFYESIAQFHRHKGFDATSQDVARKMGYQLFHLVDDEKDPVQHSRRLWFNSVSVVEYIH